MSLKRSLSEGDITPKKLKIITQEKETQTEKQNFIIGNDKNIGITYDSMENSIWLCNYYKNTSINLPLKRWKIFSNELQAVQEQVQKLKENEVCKYKLHLGGLMFCSVSSPFKCVNIRKWYRHNYTGELRASQKGTALKLHEFEDLCNKIEEISSVAGTDQIRTCKQDHPDIADETFCAECNP